MEKPLCAVLGIGPGNGAAFARRFSAEGYRLALVSRSTELSQKLAQELGDASVHSADVADPTSLSTALSEVQDTHGPIDVLIYNAGSGFWKTADELTPEEFTLSFKVNALGLLVAAQQVLPGMRKKGRGSIVIVGATASLRGRPKTAAFAAAKAAQRSLAQSLARQFFPEGIHVSLMIIDGGVGDPEASADDPKASRLRPQDIASEAFHLTQQDRSAWSFEVDLRPCQETW